MKLAYSSKKIGGYLLAFFLLLGIATVASSTAQAQWRDRDNDQYRRDRDRRDRRDDRWDRRNDRYGYGDRYNSYQIARQQGYSYGMNVGAADAQRGQSYSPQRSDFWRHAGAGASSSFCHLGPSKHVL